MKIPRISGAVAGHKHKIRPKTFREDSVSNPGKMPSTKNLRHQQTRILQKVLFFLFQHLKLSLSERILTLCCSV